MRGWTKIPQVTTVLFFYFLISVAHYSQSPLHNLRGNQHELSSVTDSEATVSSENSESEILKERERDREAAKK